MLQDVFDNVDVQADAACLDRVLRDCARLFGWSLAAIYWHPLQQIIDTRVEAGEYPGLASYLRHQRWPRLQRQLIPEPVIEEADGVLPGVTLHLPLLSPSGELLGLLLACPSGNRPALLSATESRALVDALVALLLSQQESGDRILYLQPFLRLQQDWWDAERQAGKYAAGLLLRLDTVVAVRRHCDDDLVLRARRELLPLLQTRMRASDFLVRIDEHTLLLFLKHCSALNAQRVGHDLQALAADYLFLQAGVQVSGHVATQALVFRNARDVTTALADSEHFSKAASPELLASLVVTSTPAQATILTFPGPGERVESRREPGDAHGGGATVVSLLPERGDDTGVRALPGFALHGGAMPCHWVMGQAGDTAAGESTELAALRAVANLVQSAMRRWPAGSLPTFMLEWRSGAPDVQQAEAITEVLARRHVPASAISVMVSSDRLLADLRRWLPFMARWQRQGGQVGLIGTGNADATGGLLRLTSAAWLRLDTLCGARRDEQTLSMLVDPQLQALRVSGVQLLAGNADTQADVRLLRARGVDIAFGRAAGRSRRLDELLHEPLPGQSRRR